MQVYPLNYVSAMKLKPGDLVLEFLDPESVQERVVSDVIRIVGETNDVIVDTKAGKSINFRHLAAYEHIFQELTTRRYTHFGTFHSKLKGVASDLFSGLHSKDKPTDTNIDYLLLRLEDLDFDLTRNSSRLNVRELIRARNGLYIVANNLTERIFTWYNKVDGDKLESLALVAMKFGITASGMMKAKADEYVGVAPLPNTAERVKKGRVWERKAYECLRMSREAQDIAYRAQQQKSMLYCRN